VQAALGDAQPVRQLELGARPVGGDLVEQVQGAVDERSSQTDAAQDEESE